jgi:hypothetical protein
MPYREKVAWLSLIAMAVTFGPYFTLTAIAPPSELLPNLRALGVLAATAVAQMLILGAGHLWLRIRSPQDARAPADERDRAITRLSIGVAYYVLIAGMILVGVVMPFNSGGWTLINAAIAMIVLAEVVHYGVTVWSYRRGWHD